MRGSATEGWTGPAVGQERSREEKKVLSACGGLAGLGMGIDAPRYAGSSQTRDRTSVPCIVRWILNLWTTREAQTHGLLIGITHRVSGLEARVLCVSAQKEFSKKQSNKREMYSYTTLVRDAGRRGVSAPRIKWATIL